MRYSLLIFITLISFLFHVQLKGQEYKLLIKYETSTPNDIINSYENFKGDSTEIQQKLKLLLNDLQENGYLSVSIDSVRFDSINVFTDIYIGEQYYWSRLDFSNLESGLLDELNLEENNNNTVNLNELYNVKSEILSYYENSGYPFVKVKLSAFEIDSSLLNATLEVEKGDFYKIDSIIIKGDPRISSNYIKRILQIGNNTAFNQEKINAISKKISDLKFLKEIKPAEIEFREKGVDLYLYLKDKKANMFNGIIGFLPKSEETGELLITGELNLNLLNSFGGGEEISLNWEKMESSTQKLDLGFMYPYLFRTNLGLDTDFELYKKDSSFLSLNAGLGLRLFLTYDDYIKAYYRYKSSSRIGKENISTLMNYADIKSNIFGAQYYLNDLDYRFNPRKGIELNLFAGAGLKNIDDSQNSIDSLNADKSTLELELGLNLDFHFPLYKNFVFHFGNKTRYLDQFADNNKEVIFFENELYRFGGATSLRGFDESIFYASIYSIQNVEIKYLFEQNSAFYIFWNGAYYYKNVLQEVTEDFPWGFGIGLDFETKAGVFSLSYALGKQFENSFEIQSAKIHFGYVNRF
ncbi:MAG: hypothetical protein GQ564_13555 [Bacteroidales bacterium]|nr:hypothetical protein [Bacteroidales bacterium]